MPAANPGWRPWHWLALVLATVAVTVLAVVGTTGAVRYVTNFWQYRGFPPPNAPHSVTVVRPGGPHQVPVILPAVQSITVRGPAIGGYPDPVTVVLPAGYASHPAQRYPVLYLLHGFPGGPTQFVNVGQVAAVEATLVAAGRMKPMILVIPTGTRSFLSDQEWANGVSHGNAWETFVAHDLVKAIDARYRTVPDARGRGIAGLSEGGYGALNIGLHHPATFGLLESWSGYMWADNLPAVFGHSAARLAYNSPASWVRTVAPQLRAGHTFVWFYSGASDALSVQNRVFAAELARLGVPHHFFEAPGKHNWRLWRAQMPQALITASDHMSHG